MVPLLLYSRYGLRVIKLLVLFLPLVSLLPACVELSPAGAQVRILKEEPETELSACRSLGQVSVSSEDALRNAAAAMSGDTALMTLREVGSNFYIRGSIYRCKDGVSALPMTNSAPVIQNTPINESEVARKLAKCREKGGVWTDHQCIIMIE